MAKVIHSQKLVKSDCDAISASMPLGLQIAGTSSDINITHQNSEYDSEESESSSSDESHDDFPTNSSNFQTQQQQSPLQIALKTSNFIDISKLGIQDLDAEDFWQELLQGIRNRKYASLNLILV